MNDTRALLDRIDRAQRAPARPSKGTNAAWNITHNRGTVTLTMLMDNGQRADLTLLAQDAMTLGDTIIQYADDAQRKRAA